MAGPRERAMTEAEQLLDAGAVSHNHFNYYLDATESAFDHSEWDRMQHYADRMAAYARNEPLPFSDFVVARAKALSEFGRGNRGPEVLNSLRQLRKQAEAASLLGPVVPIDAALALHETGGT